MTLMKRVLREFWANKFYLLFLFSLLVQLLAYGYSLLTATFFREPFTLSRLLTFIALLAGFYALQSLMGGLVRIYSEKKARVYQRSLRRRSLVTILRMPSEKIINLGLQYIKEIVSDANNQLFTVVSSYMTSVVNMLIGLVVLTVSLSQQSLWIAGMALVLIACTIAVHMRLLKKKVRLAKEYFAMNASYRAMVSDVQNNTLTIKKLSAEEYFAKKIDASSHDVDAKSVEKTAYDVQCQWLFDLFTYAILFLILGSIALKLRQDPSYSALFWVIFYTGIFTQLKGQIAAVTTTIQSYVDFRVSMQRYDELMRECEIEDVGLLHRKWREILAENIDFAYQSSGRAIHCDRFVIHRGDHISLTGPSGSGKSTFLGVLRGELEKSGGIITYDTRKKTRVVPYIEDCVFISQALNLFNDTLRNNLCLGQDIPDEQLYALLERAGMREWAQALPDGLDSMISENAANLSDGQKMRIKILRGIVEQRQIIIMDEPSSNLDAQSTERILKLIREDLAEKTVIISTHDVELVRVCNRHYVTDAAGRITEYVPPRPGQVPLAEPAMEDEASLEVSPGKAAQ